MQHTTDVAIIGAGPVGLFGIFEAGMLKIKSHVIDTLEMAGGQCSALYPEKPIYDIPAHPAINGQDLVEKLLEQAEPFKPTYHFNQQVDSLKANDDGTFTIGTSAGTTIEAKAVMIAAGCGAFGPNRPPLDGLEQYEGTSVFYAVPNREAFRDKNIVIAGGGDSAVDWAISLSEIASHVSIVHRRAKFRCAPDSLDKLKALAKEEKVSLVTPYQLHSLEGENGKLEHVVVSDLDGNTKHVKADVLLPFFGLKMELGPIANWGLNIDNHHITVDPATMETSIPGIYAVGDIATYPGKLKLILSGFSEAAMAAHAMYSRIYPEQALHFEYSTTKGVQSS